MEEVTDDKGAEVEAVPVTAAMIDITGTLTIETIQMTIIVATVMAVAGAVKDQATTRMVVVVVEVVTTTIMATQTGMAARRGLLTTTEKMSTTKTTTTTIGGITTMLGEIAAEGHITTMMNDTAKMIMVTIDTMTEHPRPMTEGNQGSLLPLHQGFRV